ncbi:MAG: exodeoxyribonuclease V subunit gamma [Lachnospiraceae bacterium]|nr:exodeoxyribonuclease V subunit gamma [Candidatus Colinaster equi]
MSLQLVLGPCGSGKSTYIYNNVIKAAKENPKQSYLVIVPDQFTMQTQSDMVKMTSNGGMMPGGGIMNIDVLSFMRLAHRVFEETGGGNRPVLDDTGKNLILRKCAEDVSDKIPYLAGKLNKAGYIHEVKSAISEFMQYDLDDEAIKSLVKLADSGRRKALAGKLEELNTIYGYFREYIGKNYITTEESMDILAQEIYKSNIVRHSVVVLDGFTGFTPIQNKVIRALLDVCDKVIVTITMDGESVNEDVKKKSLFSFSKETYDILKRIASEQQIEIESDIILPAGIRYKDNQMLGFLERNIYSYPVMKYTGTCNDSLQLTECKNISDEVLCLVHGIRRLLRDKNVQYRDIAVITGNLDAYKSEIDDVFEDYDIPVYIDETKKITHNPFVEYVLCALEMIIEDFSFDSVLAYLRTGFAGLTASQTDMLENYILETGIRGAKMYGSVFTRYTRAIKLAESEYNRKRDADAENAKNELSPVPDMLKAYDDLRVKLMATIAPLQSAGVKANATLQAGNIVRAIYDFMVQNKAFEKLTEYEEHFANEGDPSREKEYAQIYVKTCKLLEQIYNLIGEEKMSLEEFYDILKAGFDELEVGTIPQSVDRIIVGDMERTRLKPVKYLFFLGLNDGWVPKAGGKGGIISDSEREYLTENGARLAPSPRQQMYIDRFYLYLTLTKPSDGLILSYIAMDNEETAMRPSYMVDRIRKMYDRISENGIITRGIESAESRKEASLYYARLVSKYAKATINEQEISELISLSSYFGDDEAFLTTVVNNAFYRYNGKTIDSIVAGLLYGSVIYGSISKMERYAGCAYSYFLKYGLQLNKRKEYGIDNSDMGTIYHGVLERFIDGLQKRGLNWFNFDEETAAELVDEAVEEEAVRYTDAILFESEQNKYITDRMKAIMRRTVNTLAYQLRKSSYVPIAYEMSFSRQHNLGKLNLALNEEEKLKLSGKIDRLDVDDKGERLYVKVVDYKSGNKDFSLMSFYKGLQLQMVVYMNAAAYKLKNEYPDKQIVPGAMLYYHIDDPIIDASQNDTVEMIEDKIRKGLRAKGVIDDSEEVLEGLDNSKDAESDVIAVKRQKNGQFGGAASLYSAEDMELIGKYADYKIRKLAEEMLDGNISINPTVVKNSASDAGTDSCAYCEYNHVCGFDKYVSGYEKEVEVKMDDAMIFDAMRDELSKEENKNG